MKKEEAIILSIYIAGQDIISPIRLQKILFLLKELRPSLVEKDFYNFVPYNYGPFAQEIYWDVGKLQKQGFILSQENYGRGWTTYLLTEKGKNEAVSIMARIPSKDTDFLRKVVNWVKNLSFKELLSAIYKAFPEYKENSIFTE